MQHSCPELAQLAMSQWTVRGCSPGSLVSTAHLSILLGRDLSFPMMMEGDEESTEKQVNKGQGSAKSRSCCNRLLLTMCQSGKVQYNFLNEQYLTLQKLHKSKLQSSEICYRCGMEFGSFLNWLSLVHDEDLFYDFCDTLTKITGSDFLVRLLDLWKTLRVVEKCRAETWKTDSLLPFAKRSNEMNICFLHEKKRLHFQNLQPY